MAQKLYNTKIISGPLGKEKHYIIMKAIERPIQCWPWPLPVHTEDRIQLSFSSVRMFYFKMF